MPPQLDRKSTRLQGHNYASEATYFVTICTHNSQCIFGKIVDGQMLTNRYGKCVEDAWATTIELRRELVAHAFVVMPNHVLMLFSLDPASLPTEFRTPDALPSVTTPGAVARPRLPKSVSTMVGGFKGDVTRRVRAASGRIDVTIWQERFHDRIVRDQQEFETVHRYIVENPARLGEDRFNPDIAR